MMPPAVTSVPATGSSGNRHKSAPGSGITTPGARRQRPLPHFEACRRYGLTGWPSPAAAPGCGRQGLTSGAGLPAAAPTVAPPPIGATRDNGAVPQPSTSVTIAIGVDRGADEEAPMTEVPVVMETTKAADPVEAVVVTPANGCDQVARRLSERGDDRCRRLGRRTG